MTEINTRPPSKNEYSLMENLYKEMYQLIDSSPPPVEWVTNVYEQSISGERNYWLALLDSNIVGFVDFKVIPFHQGSEQKFARIFDFFIRPSVQRCGYGTQLARKVISSVKEQGAINIELNVLPDNKAALYFWQSLGFNLHLYALQMSIYSDSRITAIQSDLSPSPSPARRGEQDSGSPFQLKKLFLFPPLVGEG